MSNHRTSRVEKRLLLAWFFANLCIGIFIVHDFGISYDEWGYYFYARNSVDAYASFFSIAYTPILGPSFMPYYGSAFVILIELTARLVHSITPDVFTVDIWHFSYFLAFQAGGLCLFSLSRRWFNPWSAWSILGLYTFQPVLWGHAFINPKDIPFMAFFLLALWSGVRLADSLEAPDVIVFLKPRIRQHWESLDRQKRIRFQNLLKMEALAFLVIVALAILLPQIVERLFILLFSAAPDSPAAGLFQHFAVQAAGNSIDNYVARALALAARIEFWLLITGILLPFVYFFWISASGNIEFKKPTGATGRAQSIRAVLKELPSRLRSPGLILAGTLLGLTISIRVLGPLAGLIVIISLAARLRQRSLAVIAAYLLYTGLASYLTWPYLWSNPVGHFLESLTVMADYPWTGRVLFQGQFMKAAGLPLSYLPLLLNLQLTEPLIALIYLGGSILIWRLLVKTVKLELLLILFLGAVMPLTGLIVFRVPLYDNFRQIIFILPLLFLMAGAALDVIYSRIRHPALRLALLTALLLPGVQAIVNLHPYQYIYYNSFVGGPRGAFRRFELDYWATSYREAAEWLNINAPSGALIWANNPGDLMEFYLRNDLILHPEQGDIDYDYIVTTTRYNDDLDLYPQANTVYLIQRSDAVLAVIKKP